MCWLTVVMVMVKNIELVVGIEDHTGGKRYELGKKMKLNTDTHTPSFDCTRLKRKQLDVCDFEKRER